MQPVVTVIGRRRQCWQAIRLEHLLKQGIQVRAVGRSAEHLAPLAAQASEAHTGTLEDTSFLTTAFRGAGVVFALLPGSPPNASTTWRPSAGWPRRWRRHSTGAGSSVSSP